jgi:hypothetical protein
MRPQTDDYHPFYAGYIASVRDDDDVLSGLEEQSGFTQRLIASIDEERGSYRYADGKWSVKEVIGHFIDSERIMAYRALAIARGETKPLPGFDENAYVREAGFETWRMSDLAEHYALARRSSIILFQSFPSGVWSRRGVANDSPVTVNALAWIILGHERHHLNVLRERYQVIDRG